jgi:glucosamine kinase
MATLPYVLGVDGGGTRTRCVVVESGGGVLGSAEAGPSNYLRVGLEEALANVRESVVAAAEAAGVVLPAICASYCLAGTGRPHDHDIVLRGVSGLDLAERPLVYTDAEAALAGAHALEPGAIVIAGTGAVAYGLDAGGSLHRADGWGPLLGDEGSGYWIGREALQAVMRAHDHRGPATSLTGALLSALQAREPPQLVNSLSIAGADSSDVAALAAVCARAAHQGDTVASSIMRLAGTHLAASAAAVLSAMALRQRPAIAVTGGVFQDVIVRQAFEAALRESHPDANLRPPRFPAGIGAALLALHACGLQVNHVALANPEVPTCDSQHLH